MCHELCFLLWLVGTGGTWTDINFGHYSCYAVRCPWAFPIALSSFLIGVGWPIFSWRLIRILCISSELSLCASLSRLVYCPAKFSHFRLPGLPAPYSQLRNHQLPPSFSLCSLWHENSLRVINYNNFTTCHVWFPSVREHYSSNSNVQYLENHCFTYLVCF